MTSSSCHTELATRWHLEHATQRCNCVCHIPLAVCHALTTRTPAAHQPRQGLLQERIIPGKRSNPGQRRGASPLLASCVVNAPACHLAQARRCTCEATCDGNVGTQPPTTTTVRSDVLAQALNRRQRRSGRLQGTVPAPGGSSSQVRTVAAERKCQACRAVLETEQPELISSAPANT